jgi:AraC-like DNA-binding protein
MTILVDTRSVAPEERFEYWTESTSKVFFPLAIGARAPRPFAGRVLGHDLGPLGVFRVTGDPNDCMRTRRGIAVSDPEHLQLHAVRRGRCRVGQDDRMSALTAGDLTTCDSSRPYAIHAEEPFELHIVVFPKVLLRPHTDRLCGRTAARIPGSGGVASLVGPFLADLVDRLDEGTVGEGDADLAESLLGLLRALHSEAPAGAALARRPLVDRVKAHIEAHLAEPGLGPDSIAAAHFISTRYLHKLFEAEDVTVSAWIRARRLDRCRRDLGDPALGASSIGAIGARWGFAQPDRFSRLFRAAYGASPSEYRAVVRSR